MRRCDIYYFVSDLHLGLQSEEKERFKERLFADFLNNLNPDATALFILGDLFDYWFEYKKVVQKGYYRTFTALQDLAERGTEIYYIIGNHDFLHRDYFEKEFGAKVYQDSLSIELDNKKFFMAHGDGLVKNDYGYLVLKKVLRNKFIQKCYSLIHPDLGIGIASRTSRTSREYTKEKHYGEIDGVLEAAESKIDDGYDYVLFGHTHQRTYMSLGKGKYINLGTWLDKPCYGIFSSQQFEIIDI